MFTDKKQASAENVPGSHGSLRLGTVSGNLESGVDSHVVPAFFLNSSRMYSVDFKVLHGGPTVRLRPTAADEDHCITSHYQVIGDPNRPLYRSPRSIQLTPCAKMNRRGYHKNKQEPKPHSPSSP